MAGPTDNPVNPYGSIDDILSTALEEDDAEAQAEVQSARQRLMDRVLVSRDLAILGVAIVLFAGFTIGNPQFASVDNLVDLARRMPNIGIIAVGMTFLFIARELDLSVGSHMAFATSFMAFL